MAAKSERDGLAAALKSERTSHGSMSGTGFSAHERILRQQSLKSTKGSSNSMYSLLSNSGQFSCFSASGSFGRPNKNSPRSGNSFHSSPRESEVQFTYTNFSDLFGEERDNVFVQHLRPEGKAIITTKSTKGVLCYTTVRGVFEINKSSLFVGFRLEGDQGDEQVQAHNEQFIENIQDSRHFVISFLPEIDMEPNGYRGRYSSDQMPPRPSPFRMLQSAHGPAPCLEEAEGQIECKYHGLLNTQEATVVAGKMLAVHDSCEHVNQMKRHNTMKPDEETLKIPQFIKAAILTVAHLMFLALMSIIFGNGKKTNLNTDMKHTTSSLLSLNRDLYKPKKRKSTSHSSPIIMARSGHITDLHM